MRQIKLFDLPENRWFIIKVVIVNLYIRDEISFRKFIITEIETTNIHLMHVRFLVVV